METEQTRYRVSVTNEYLSVLVLTLPCVSNFLCVSLLFVSMGCLCGVSHSTTCLFNFRSYRTWAEGFGSRVTHILVDESISPMPPIFRGHADAIIRANAALGDRFAPLPYGFIQSDEDELPSDIRNAFPGTVVRRRRILHTQALGVEPDPVPLDIRPGSRKNPASLLSRSSSCCGSRSYSCTCAGCKPCCNSCEYGTEREFAGKTEIVGRHGQQWSSSCLSTRYR